MLPLVGSVKTESNMLNGSISSGFRMQLPLFPLELINKTQLQLRKTTLPLDEKPTLEVPPHPHQDTDLTKFSMHQTQDTTSNSSVTSPSETLPTLTLKPKSKSQPKSPKKSPDNQLLSAAQFVLNAQPKHSINPSEIHCRLWANQLSAFGGILSAGIGIQETIECCPHTQRLVNALKECPDATNLTLLPSRELSIKSGNFQATIPCVEQTVLPAIYGDQQQYPVSIEFQQALEYAGSVVNERNKIILYSSVLMMENSVLASNGDVIVEAWHGCNTPNRLIVPKLFVSAIKRTRGKAVYSLGCSPDTLTAYYPDGSWFKTRLHHDDEFPNLQGFLNLPVPLEPTPLGFWNAVDRLAPFSKDGLIYLRKEGMCTDSYQTDGAINTCDGLPDGISFPISALRLIQPFAEKIAFNVTKTMTYFQGQTVRGVIAQRELK
jgi:hypothetical protein